MKRIYVPTQGPEDWRSLLAEPDRQWKSGFSAKALAEVWEEANGFPETVKAVLAEAFRELEPLIILPEHKVALPGSRAASQNDVWVLAKSGTDLVSIAVEGKVSEPFGPTVEQWNPSSTPGRQTRLAFLKKTLGLQHIPPQTRYQLLHRTASALLEATRFTARHAVVLVHSFSSPNEWFEDFAAFVALFGLQAAVNKMVSVGAHEQPLLHFGWVAEGQEHHGC